MQKKEEIIQKLREQGCRITTQRQILLDIILQEQCSSCKEIYYRAVKQDDSIGMSTVYRMVSALEEIGVLSRDTMFQLRYREEGDDSEVCRLEFTDGTFLELSAEKWKEVVETGLKQCGYGKESQLKSLFLTNG